MNLLRGNASLTMCGAACILGGLLLAFLGCGNPPPVTLPTDPAPLPKPEAVRTTNEPSGVKVDVKK